MYRWDDNSKTYEPVLQKRVSIEIGDKKQPQKFYPRVKLLLWDNECNFSVGVIDDTPEEATLTVENEVIKWKKQKIEAHFYEKEIDEGAFEFEVVLNEKPLSNVLELSTNIPKEVEFFYQPALTPEEIAEGCERPENVVGSYAVYHSSKKNNEYKTGKAFHLYRPKIIDSQNNWVWGDLDLKANESKVTITISQEFLNTAVYPVTVDPTFGYTSRGATGAGTSSIIFCKYTSPNENGSITSIKSYSYSMGGTIELGHALYSSDGSGNPCDRLAVDTQNASVLNDGSYTGSLYSTPVSYDFAANTDYWFARWSASSTQYYSDTTGSVSTYNSGQTFENWPASFSGTSFTLGTKRVSIYAEYTAAPANTDVTITSPAAEVTAQADNPVIEAGFVATATAQAPNPAITTTVTIVVSGVAAEATATFQQAIIISASPFAGGNGTAGDPYQIGTLTQLDQVRNYLSSYFILLNDIDASSTSTWNSGEGWIPIGSDNLGNPATISTLTGGIDGQGYKISNLYINRPNVPYMSFLRNLMGYIKNIFFENIYIYATNQIALLYCMDGGGLLSNVAISGEMNGWSKTSSFTSSIDDSSRIEDCFSTVAVKIRDNSSAYIAGLVYDAGATTGASQVVNTYFAGTFTIPEGSTGLVSGGIIARELGTIPLTVTDCYWDTQVSGCSTDLYATGKTTSEMKQQATYNNWDFTDIWSINEGVSYPALKIILAHMTLITAVTATATANTAVPALVCGITISGAVATAQAQSVSPNLAVGSTINAAHANAQAQSVTPGLSTSYFVNAVAAAAQATSIMVSIITDIIVISVATGATATFQQGIAVRSTLFAGGDGTALDPYQISSLTELNEVRNYLSSNFILTADIDASATVDWNSGAGWTPIGTAAEPFTGTINGDYHKITELHVLNTTNDNLPVGLFGVISSTGTAVQCLGVESASIVGRIRAGTIAGIIAQAVTFENCWATGTLQAWGSGGYAGGLIGYSSATSGTTTFDTCYANTTLTGDYVGGLIGGAASDHVFTNCLTRGTLDADYRQGGLLGYGIDQYVNADIECCFTACAYTFRQTALYDAFANAYTGTVTYSYYDEDITNGCLNAGYTTAQCKVQSNFTGFDFQSKWGINASVNDGYPSLRVFMDYPEVFVIGQAATALTQGNNPTLSTGLSIPVGAMISTGLFADPNLTLINTITIPAMSATAQSINPALFTNNIITSVTAGATAETPAPFILDDHTILIQVPGIVVIAGSVNPSLIVGNNIGAATSIAQALANNPGVIAGIGIVINSVLLAATTTARTPQMQIGKNIFATVTTASGSAAVPLIRRGLGVTAVKAASEAKAENPGLFLNSIMQATIATAGAEALGVTFRLDYGIRSAPLQATARAGQPWVHDKTAVRYRIKPSTGDIYITGELIEEEILSLRLSCLGDLTAYQFQEGANYGTGDTIIRISVVPIGASGGVVLGTKGQLYEGQYIY